jgi:hypothetical protein
MTALLDLDAALEFADKTPDGEVSVARGGAATGMRGGCVELDCVDCSNAAWALVDKTLLDT